MLTKTEAKELVLQMVESFATQIDHYKTTKYNETQTRRDYIDPFFEALGWDIANLANLPENYREVVLEDKIKIEGKTKSPDYCFALGGNRKFFLEAKKPSVVIKDDMLPAYQVRRYGWSAKLPVSVITDFEEFAIYDCTTKPEPTDKASINRLKYLKFTDYAQEWDWIWDTFSKEQVQKGSLEAYAQIEKKGNSSVDAEFLRSLDSWRETLARDMIRQNPQITEDDLNFALQKNLDRIIFLRICEDRAIEPYGKLQQSLKGDFYANLFQYFAEADQKYNSGLFDFRKDQVSRNLKMSNDAIESVISELYYPKSPYEFSVIPVEMLGNAYEQFLGKTIKLKTQDLSEGLGQGRKAEIEIEEKPEVRKAGGVYYTPQYIVEYIVRNTIGTKIAELEKGEGLIEAISRLKICDPACGSGSFLLGAYQFLLDWHLDFYLKNPTPALPYWEGVKNPSQKGKGRVGVSSPLTPDGTLTSQEKRRILLNNIYGVDIDANAVEVTKLSLLLKAMEGETTASIKQSLQIFHERVLPTLDNNIKSGNSLIDLDFYENQIDFEPAVEKKIKPFNWEQQFAEVFKAVSPSQNGRDGVGFGFDIILGNPPYVRADLMLAEQKKYLSQTYQTFEGSADLYVYFIEKSLKLLKKEGLYGIIVANKWLKAKYALKLRGLLRQRQLVEIVDFGDLPVFGKVAAYPCILLVKNSAISLFAQTQNIPQKIQDLLTDFDLHKEETDLPKGIKESIHLDRSKSLQELENQVFTLQKYKKALNGLYANIQEIADEIDILRKNLVEKIQFRATLVQELKNLNLPNYVETNGFVVNQEVLKSEGWNLQNNQSQEILAKITQKGIPLGLYIGKVYRGVLTGLNEAFVIDEATKNLLISEDSLSAELIKPYLAGRDIKRYQQPLLNKYLIFTKRGVDIERYQAIKNHLLAFKDQLMPKPKDYKGNDWQGRKSGNYQWYEIQDAIDYVEYFEQPKIMYQVFQVSPCFIYDTQNFFCNNSIWIIPSHDKYLLGLLNSKLGWFLISNYCTQIQNGYQLIWEYLSKIPIKTIDFQNKTEKDLHDRIVKNVETILELHAQPKGYATEQQKQRIQYLENQIDTWVMDLYGLTAEERELL